MLCWPLCSSIELFCVPTKGDLHNVLTQLTVRGTSSIEKVAHVVYGVKLGGLALQGHGGTVV